MTSVAKQNPGSIGYGDHGKPAGRERECGLSTGEALLACPEQGMQQPKGAEI